MDIARPLRAAGMQVCMGGFHVSGCIAMLPEMPPELQEAMDLGISLFAGEAEGSLDEVRRDIRIIQRELPVDLLEPHCLTPLRLGGSSAPP
jgi:hypothetical protein